MAAGEEMLGALREAVKVSPENVALRQALAEALMGVGRAEEAEREYRRAVAMAPGDVKLKVGLAAAFEQQGKGSEAFVLLEDVVKGRDVPGRAHLLFARLLHRAGDDGRAAAQYRRAVEADESLEDLELAAELGVGRKGYEEPGDEEVGGRVRAREGAEGSGLGTEVERPDASFKDVGGLEGLKDEIRMKIIHPITHADLYKAYGKSAGGGILMYGPPGCGKTHLARATAGEIKAGFIAVGISDVLDMWIGASEKNLHEVFDRARRARPCVLFFDEVDALAASRSDMRTHGGRHLINQFLSEMDGIQAANEGVLILAATNAPWHVDAAFRRPGRFDRILFVPPPDAGGRAAILRVHVKGKPVEAVEFDAVAKKTEGFSGADLRAVVDVAVEAKLREAMKAGVPKPITTKDLLAAAGEIKPSTREWFATARNYAMYSNQGGHYDDILKYLKM